MLPPPAVARPLPTAASPKRFVGQRAARLRWALVAALIAVSGVAAATDPSRWPQRVARLPQVPTTAEQGFPKLVVAIWYGLLAPAGTPPDVVARLQEAYAVAVHSPATKRRIDALGYQPVDDAPGRFATALADEIAAVREALGPRAKQRR